MNFAAELLGRRAGSEAPALVAAGGRETSFAALAAAVERTARELEAAGALRGRGPVARVGLACPDGPEHVVLALAVLRAGGCLVPLPAELGPRERGDLLRRVAVDAVITVGRGEARSAPAAAIDLGEGRVAAVSPVAPSGEAPFPETAFAALDPAFVRFSSGTTGAAKGIVLSHATLRARVSAAQAALGIGPGDRVVWLLPMAHHFVASILLYLWSGATILLVPSPLAADGLAVGRDRGGSVLYAAPFHHALLAAEASGEPWPSLRLAISTATALPSGTARAFLDRFGVPLGQALGVMEVGLPALNLANAAAKPESVGRPAPGFAIELRDESGRPVAPGQVGALHVRGPGLFDAYLSPWRRRDDVLRDGWFATGDLAVADADGDLRLVGRTHTVIDVGGLKCFPEEVEAVLAEHPGIRTARVAPRRHARVGAVPIAEIVPADPARPPDPAAIARHCRAHLARYKVPVEFRIVSALDATASGKVRRG